jgi:hypothetical protein
MNEQKQNMQYCVLQVIIKLASLVFVLAFKKLEYSYISYLWTCSIWINIFSQKDHETDIVIQIKCICFAPNSIPKLYTFPYLHFYVSLHVEYTYCVSVKETGFVITQG